MRLKARATVVGASLRIVARMERQIALCDLACNPGSIPHNGLSRIAPTARKSARLAPCGLRGPIKLAPMRATGAGRVAELSIRAIQFALLSLIMHAIATSSALSKAASGYPAETIRIVVPFGPASGPDFAIRALAPTLQELLKQSV